MNDTDAGLILDELRQLRAEVRLLAGRSGLDTVRLSQFLTAAYAFGGSSCWSAGELIGDARNAGRRDLLACIATITAGCADPPRSLGKFCFRHENVKVDGLHLERVKRLWSVTADANG